MSLQIPVTSRPHFEHAFPTVDAAAAIYDSQDLNRAIEAYRFFYPAVSTEGIFNGLREIGIEDGKQLGLLAGDPRHVCFTANSDTPYAMGVWDLKKMGSVVVDVPPGPFMGLLNDHHQRWITDIGIPGPDAGNGAKYLILPPGLTAQVPRGFLARRSETFKILLVVRVLPGKAGVAGALEALRQVRVYALADTAHSLPYVDITHHRLDCTPLRWEGNIEFWKKLAAIIDSEPPLEEFRPMYGELAALGIEKGSPFAPTPRMARILEVATQQALEQMRVEAFASQRPDRMVWEDRRWEWIGLVPDDADFETRTFLDLEARDRWFFQAVIASPAMFRRKVGAGSIYFLAARDRAGDHLDGGKSYRLEVPCPIPAKLFWSVTAYDAGTRSQVQTPQGKAVLGSLHDRFDWSAEDSMELYFGPRCPPGKERWWIQTEPGQGFFLYFRLYGPESPGLDGTWRLGDLVELGELRG